MKRTAPPAEPHPSTETQHLLYELRVHQAEIEVQNEDLRSSQYELEALLNRYTDLYDFAPIGYCTLDPWGVVLEANIKASQLLGMERRRLIGKPFSIYVDREDRGRFRKHLSQALEAGVRESYELKLAPRGGKPFDAQIEESIAKDPYGGFLLRMAIIDISRQKRAERESEHLLACEQKARLEAQEASRLKDEFLAIVSHELRTPLNAIYGWANLLRTGELDPATEESALETMERNAKVQEHLINDLLDLSRITTGKLSLRVRPSSLAEIIETAVATVRQAADAKGIRIKLDIDRSIESMMVDPDRIQQVLWNLLSNAIKFTPEEGKIDLFLERIDRSIQIRVQDSGAGIPPDFLPYIFDHFRQLESGNTRSHGGLGVGLALVRHLVELHGGSVAAESAGIGKGTTVLIRLPIRAVSKAGEGRSREE